METNKRLKAVICPMAAMLLMAASITSCSSDENITANTQNKGFQLKLNGYLENNGAKTRGAGAQWEDVNGATGGGLKFKWTKENASEMYAGYFSKSLGMIIPTTDNKCYSKINIVIDDNNSAKAELSSETNFTLPQDKITSDDIIFCFAPIGNPINITQTEVTKNDLNGVKNSYFPMSFPQLFTQENANSTKGINEYMYIYGQANLPNNYGSELNAKAVDITFHHVPATVRYVISNKRGETVTIKSVKMNFDSDVLPTTGQFRWDVVPSSGDFSTSILFDATRTSSVTTQFGANGTGLSVDTTNPLLGYAVVAPSQETITGNATFTITDGDGREYVSDCFSAEDLLADVTKESKFLSGYVYTAWLLLDENKLTVGDVTVNGWDEVAGGDADNSLMSVTNWCSTDTYKTQREALTTLTLDGAAITSTEVTNYMQGNFATYFPNVTTLNIAGKSLNQILILQNNTTVTTVIGNALKSLPQSAFNYGQGNTTITANYIFPNVETVGAYCFKRSYGIREFSMPKLKAFSTQILFGVGVEKACFASLTDFTNASQEFTASNVHLAFGATTEFNFGTTKTPLDIFQNQSANIAATTTLYLNEDGYEYKNNVGLTNEGKQTWRGVTFKEIKKYSEYSGKKD